MQEGGVDNGQWMMEMGQAAAGFSECIAGETGSFKQLLSKWQAIHGINACPIVKK
jgi:hypothetical protein